MFEALAKRTVSGAAAGNLAVAGIRKADRLISVEAVGQLPPAPANVAAAAVVGGGTFAAGTYYWKVSAINAQGESIASVEVSAVIALNGSATITWNQVPGASGYRVYRGAAAGAQTLYYAVGLVGTFTDTNAAGTAGVPIAAGTGFTAPIDLTAEFTATADGIINNGAGTSTLGKLVTVLWEKMTGRADFTSGRSAF